MDPEHKRALSEALLCLADDELILGHRASEWCGHAPILEEDIAFANLALDEIGHAAIWYAIAGELTGNDPADYPDRMVYFRPAEGFRNLQMLELPNGDWAFSMLRQFLFDLAESINLEALGLSDYQPVADAAAKIRKEELYHLRHTRAWVHRLALGTEESHERMQFALNQLWPYTAQIFLPVNNGDWLAENNILPASAPLQIRWEQIAREFFTETGLLIPNAPCLDIERWQHTSHLKTLVDDMQCIARLDAQASW